MSAIVRSKAVCVRRKSVRRWSASVWSVDAWAWIPAGVVWGDYGGPDGAFRDLNAPAFDWRIGDC